jgi:hypothetical protein
MPFVGNQPAQSYSSFAKQDFTTSATTSYTLDYPVANENEVALFINFVRQEPTTAYTASGTSLTLTSATSASDDMYAVFIGKAVQTVNPPAGSVNNSTIDSNAGIALTKLASTGTLTVDNIQFPATAVASANANTLDDYEEGTVTATMAPQTSGSLPLNVSIQTLGYTKIGRLVTITGLLRLATPSSPVGTFISVDNLPFVVASSLSVTLYGARGGGGVLFLDSGTGNYSVLPIEFSESESRFMIRVDASTLAANDDFRISLSYFSN